MSTRDYNNIPWGDYFYLDETSPSGIRWKVDRMGGRGYKVIAVSAGEVAGSLQRRLSGCNACWRVRLDCGKYLVHRIIHILLHGSIDIDLVIDHLDGDASNNKHSNLVLKSSRANMQNCKMASNNTSGITGVYIGFTQKGSNIYKRWIASWLDVNHKDTQRLSQ